MIPHLISHSSPPGPVAYFVQAIGSAAECISVIGLERQRLVVARQRLRGALELAQYVAAIVERVGIVRLERQRPVVVRQRLLKALELAERIAAIVERVGI